MTANNIPAAGRLLIRASSQFVRAFAVLAALCVAGEAAAEPVTVTDLVGRSVTVETPVERFVVSEGRYIPLLALLRPDDPVRGLVGTMSPLGWTQPEIERQLFDRFPEAKNIARFGNQSADSVSVEKIIELQPSLAIFGLNDHGPDARNAELISQLDAAGVSVVFIDFRQDPAANTVRSIELVGQLLGADGRAAEFIAFYRERQDRVLARTATVRDRPKVFVQVHPGRHECCWGMADGMLGPMVGLAGGQNIADAVAPGPVSHHTAEFLLHEDPDVWIGTASGVLPEYLAGASPVAIGAGMDGDMAAKSIARFLSAPEFRNLKAVRTGRAHAIWHNFYNSPFNVVVLEAFARWIHPNLFPDMDPQATLQEIFDRFLPFDLNGVYFASIAQGR